jgi:hypothetical protein
MATRTVGLSAFDRDRLALHRLLAEGFEDAAERVGVTETIVQIGDETIRVRTAGPAPHEPLTRALIRVDAADAPAPTATIDAWDSATTGRPMPLLVDNLLRVLEQDWLAGRDVRGELHAFRDGPVRAAYYGPQMLSVYDTASRSGVFWLPDAAALPWYEPAAPFRVLIEWIMMSPTRRLIHAGAVGGSTAGMLLGGAGGSGKSTTALSCVADHRFRYVSDDYVVVNLSQPITAAAVYATAKLKSLADLERLPEMKAAVDNLDRVAATPDDGDAEKAVLYLYEHVPDRVAPTTAIKALVFPRYLALDEPKFAAITHDAAFKFLAPSTIQQVPAAASEALRFMRTVTERVPAFLLGLPTEPEKIPDALTAILSEVS